MHQAIKGTTHTFRGLKQSPKITTHNHGQAKVTKSL
jgi:hypothetical protein